MTNTITPALQIYKAAQFVESVSEETANNLYLCIAKTNAWPVENTPNTPIVTASTEREFWEGMLGGKKITGADVRTVVHRNNWVANTVYTQYDQDDPLFVGASNANFYVVTTDWHVFKCLFNNNGANSVIEPSTLTTGIVESEDGYIWKYMLTVSPFERARYSTDDYIPVQTLSYDNNSLQWDVQDTAIPGAILAIEVTNAGSGYTNANSISVAIDGDGTAAIARATVNTVTNTISGIYMTAYGQGYSNAKITITDTANGVNATAKALYSPYGGHGSDPLYELGGASAIISLRINPTDSPMLTTNAAFRQVGLVKDPIRYGTSNIESNTYVSQMTEVTVSGANFDYAEGEYVYQGGNTGTATFIGLLAEWDAGNSKMKLTNVHGTPTTDTIIGANTGSVSFLTSVKNSEMIRNSGQLLFINNIAPIERDPDQVEEFKIIINF